jgi:hypothetical protein
MMPHAHRLLAAIVAALAALAAVAAMILGIMP